MEELMEEMEKAKQEYANHIQKLRNRIKEIREDLNLYSNGCIARKEFLISLVSIIGDDKRSKKIVRDLLEGYSYDEIAIELNLSRERVRQIFHKTMRRMECLTSYRELEKDNEKLLVENEALRNALSNLRLSEERYIKAPDTFDTLMIPVEELNLSVRSLNGLYYNGKKRVADIVSMRVEDLAKLRNIGKKSLLEISEKIKELGLDFNYDVDAVIAKKALGI